MFLRQLAQACSLLALASSAAPQGFVNRTADIALDHEVATGFDSVSGTSVRDWIQRGFALADIDGDGDVDLVCAGGVLANSVLRNDGGVLVDVTGASGLTSTELDTAPVLADFDGDGDVDLYMGVMDSGGFGGPGEPLSRFYRNDGAGVFEDVTELAWTRGLGHSVYAMWADVDYDGLLDVLTGEFYATDNPIYRNNGDGTFTDIAKTTGLDTFGLTHVLCVFDSDQDGWFDVFVGNDYFVGLTGAQPNNEPDMHMQGQGGDAWVDVSDGSGFDHERGIMGYALGDVNYDGLLDVYKTDVHSNRLAVNQGWPGGAVWLGEEQYDYGIECDQVPFEDDPLDLGRAVGWGTVFMDFDFDLWLDLFVVNGQVAGSNPVGQFAPRFQRNFFYRGDGPGAGFTFTDATAAVGLFDNVDDRSLAVSDFDRDGDVDLFIQPTVGKPRYFENQIDPAGQGWLMVKPVCQTSAPGGFGVVARFTDSLGYPHVRQIGQDGPTSAQHENFAYFGLGTEPTVDLEVEFPSGVTLHLPGVTPNQVLEPTEPKILEVSSRTMSISPNPRLAGTRAAPGGLGGPAGLWSVTVHAHDQAGQALDASAAVSIETPGLKPASAVLSLGGNLFRRYFYAPVTPGSHRAEVVIDGWACKIRPRVHFFDPADASGTTALVRPEAVRAGTAETFEVTVAPKDANGISLGSGDDVVLTIAGAAGPITATDLGDGRYRASFTAPATAGIYAIAVSVNGAAAAPGLTVQAAGPVASAQTLFEVEKPFEGQSAAPHQQKAKMTFRDAAGLRVGPNLDLQVVVVPNAGTEPVVWRTDVPTGQDDGDYYLILEKPNTVPPTNVSGVYEIWLDGVLTQTIGYNF